MTAKAQGWYRDPFAIHEDRYLSQGLPTKLIRDAIREVPVSTGPMRHVATLPAMLSRFAGSA